MSSVTKSAGVALVALATAGAVAWSLGGVEVASWPVVGLAMGLAFAVQWVVFVPSFVAQTEHYYDLTGSLTYLTVCAVSLAVVGRYDGRSLLMTALVAVWALRLGLFLFRRVRREGKDGRFDEIKTSAPRFFVAWTLQGLWISLTLAAYLAAIAAERPVPLGALDVVGAAVWALGFGLEVVADRQKSAFREAHAGDFVDTGLWSWSRHPNYFGEIVLWVGMALLATPTLAGWRYVAWISPVFVAFLLTKVSGIPMTEERADDRWGGDPDYERYKARTPVLVPRPPKKDR